MAMWVGALEFDLLLGDVHSLKEKRSLVRPLIADVRKRFELSVAEVDHLELHRRAGIGVAAVSPDRAHLVDVLDAVEQLVAYRPEVELLSVRRTLRSAMTDRARSLMHAPLAGLELTARARAGHAGRPRTGHQDRHR